MRDRVRLRVNFVDLKLHRCQRLVLSLFHLGAFFLDLQLLKLEELRVWLAWIVEDLLALSFQRREPSSCPARHWTVVGAFFSLCLLMRSHNDVNPRWFSFWRESVIISASSIVLCVCLLHDLVLTAISTDFHTRWPQLTINTCLLSFGSELEVLDCFASGQTFERCHRFVLSCTIIIVSIANLTAYNRRWWCA